VFAEKSNIYLKSLTKIEQKTVLSVLISWLIDHTGGIKHLSRPLGASLTAFVPSLVYLAGSCDRLKKLLPAPEPPEGKYTVLYADGELLGTLRVPPFFTGFFLLK
jgi:hypothetical protein